LAMLVGSHNLRDCLLGNGARAAGRSLLVAVARRAGYELDTEACTVTKGGKLVVRAPNSIERAAQEICGKMAGGKELKEGAARVRGAVTALLCDLGPKPRVNDEEYRAAVALHTSCEGEREGEECPLCGKGVRPGHHRWCQGLQAEPGLEHDMVRDAIVGWLAGAVAVRVRRERKLEPGVRADIEAAAPVGGQVEVDLKTLEMRCESHDGQTLVKAAEEVGREAGGLAGPLEARRGGGLGRESQRGRSELMGSILGRDAAPPSPRPGPRTENAPGRGGRCGIRRG